MLTSADSELRATTFTLVFPDVCHHHHRLRRRLRRRRRDSCRCRFEDRIEEENQQLTITVVSVLGYQKAAPWRKKTVPSGAFIWGRGDNDCT